MLATGRQTWPNYNAFAALDYNGPSYYLTHRSVRLLIERRLPVPSGCVRTAIMMAVSFSLVL